MGEPVRFVTKGPDGSPATPEERERIREGVLVWKEAMRKLRAELHARTPRGVVVRG